MRSALSSVLARPASNFAALDGVRAFMCLWMICFHTYFWQNYFLVEEDHLALGARWIMQVTVVPGYIAVDVFFLLTGFLLALPLFSKEQKAAKDGAAAGATKVDFADWCYRRFMRVTPIYAVVLVLYCAVVFRDGAFPLAVAKSADIHRLASVHWPNATHVPNSWEMAWANMMYMNQLMPFGGCMGYTWTLAVQFQSYLALPLVWNRWGAKGLVKLCKWGIVVSAIMRTVGFLQMVDMVPKSTELGFFAFFWYTNTLTRMGPILMGILLAHYSVQPNAGAWLRARPAVSAVGWALFGGAIYLSRIYDYETTMAHPPQTPWHIAVSVMVHPGGPVMGLGLAYALYAIHHRTDAVGSALSNLFSGAGWRPIAELSYLAYLLHPMVMQKLYATLWVPMSDQLPEFVMYCVTNLALTLFFALVLHVCVDYPLQSVLGRKQGADASWLAYLRKTTYVYCRGLSWLSLIAHVVIVITVLVIPHPTVAK